jgi:hypothetical protein
MASSLARASVRITSNGEALHCFYEQPGPSPALSDFLVRRVLPRVALLFGATAVHAAAIADDAGAVLLLGSAGAGKSTFSAAMVTHAGWNILSDDISVLRAGSQPEVWPGAVGVCVWPDTRLALGLSAKACRPMPGYDGKVWFEPDPDGGQTPRPVRALVFLSRSDAGASCDLRSMPRWQALMEATRRLVRFNPSDRPLGEPVRLIERMAEIVRAVPSYTLTYPATYQALPEAAGRLRQLLSA